MPKSLPRGNRRRLDTLINEAIFSAEHQQALDRRVRPRPRNLDLAQCAEQDRDERAKWAENVKIAK